MKKLILIAALFSQIATAQNADTIQTFEFREQKPEVKMSVYSQNAHDQASLFAMNAMAGVSAKLKQYREAGATIDSVVINLQTRTVIITGERSFIGEICGDARLKIVEVADETGWNVGPSYKAVLKLNGCK